MTKTKAFERFKPVEAWILWNPKRMQFTSGFNAIPTLYPNRKEADGATPINDGSSLNAYWKPMKVKIVPVRRRKSSEKGRTDA